ncbi:MAG: hypothetical protein Q7S69_09740 [Nitrosomonadaceae bacterium]|nr:hypothetical protein [Nitrosomonadaceae bacterium]
MGKILILTQKPSGLFLETPYSPQQAGSESRQKWAQTSGSDALGLLGFAH